MRFIGSAVGLPLVLALVTILCGAAFANGSFDQTEVGKRISIGSNERATEITCFGCSVRIRGHVTSDVTAFGGSVLLEDQAQVDGDLTTFGGSVRLDKGVRVGGDVTVLGGRIHRASGALVRGDMVSMVSLNWLLLIVCLPLMFFGALLALIVWLVRGLMQPSIPAAA